MCSFGSYLLRARITISVCPCRDRRNGARAMELDEKRDTWPYTVHWDRQLMHTTYGRCDSAPFGEYQTVLFKSYRKLQLQSSCWTVEVDAWVWPTKCIFQFLFSPIFDHFFVLRVIKIKWHASPLPPSQLRIGIGTPSGLAFHTFVAQYRTSVGTAIIINWIIYCFFAQRWASFVCTITTQRHWMGHRA